MQNVSALLSCLGLWGILVGANYYIQEWLRWSLLLLLLFWKQTPLLPLFLPPPLPHLPTTHFRTQLQCVLSEHQCKESRCSPSSLPLLIQTSPLLVFLALLTVAACVWKRVSWSRLEHYLQLSIVINCPFHGEGLEIVQASSLSVKIFVRSLFCRHCSS